MRRVLIIFAVVLSMLAVTLQPGPLQDVSGHKLNGLIRATILVYDNEDAGNFIWTGTTDGSLPALKVVDGYIHNLDQIIPGYIKDMGEIWIEIRVDGRTVTADRIRYLSSSGAGLRREIPVEPGEVSETLDDELQIGLPGHELYVASATTGFGVDAPVDRVSIDGAVSLKGGSAPTTTADFGKIFVNDVDGHLYYINDTGVVTDLTVDANALQSVSSSANHTGRTSHMRLIPGDYTDITESATDDTIFVQYNVACSGATACSAPPAAPALMTGASTVCTGVPGAAYGVPPVAGASYYIWTVPSDAVVTTGMGSNSVNVVFGSADGNVCARAYNDCGSSSDVCTAVAINRPTTPGSITGPTLVCSGSTGESFFIPSVPGATNYIWTLPPGAVLASGTGSPNITVNFGSLGGDVCVQTENSCGISTSSCLPVTITDTPATPGSITGSTSLCGGVSGVGYSISPVAEATSYTWTVPSGATVTSGAGTSSITVTYGTTSGQVCVTATSICGTSDPACISVTVTNPPSAPGTISGSDAVPPSTSGETYSISAVSGATSYSWSVTGDATLVGTPTGTSATVNFGTSAGTTVSVCVSAENICGASSETCKTVTIAVPSGSTTFAYTGSQQTFTVPAGITSVTIECWGAQGGTGNGSSYTGLTGGNGGYATGTLAVTPGQTLYVYVGGRGGDGIYSSGTGGAGGWNGGGTKGNYGSGYAGGGGGGGSDVRSGGTAYTNRVIVGGGGGGGGTWTVSYGGTGGYPNGGTGGDIVGGGPGYGGTQSAGGTGSGYSGTLGVGGDGASGSCGGGGGGGYYGGGGSGGCNSSGAGGGSSYIGGVTSTSTSNGVRTGNGQVIISW